MSAFCSSERTKVTSTRSSTSESDTHSLRSCQVPPRLGVACSWRLPRLACDHNLSRHKHSSNSWTSDALLSQSRREVDSFRFCTRSTRGCLQRCFVTQSGKSDQMTLHTTGAFRRMWINIPNRRLSRRVTPGRRLSRGSQNTHKSQTRRMLQIVIVSGDPPGSKAAGPRWNNLHDRHERRTRRSPRNWRSALEIVLVRHHLLRGPQTWQRVKKLLAHARPQSR